MDQQTCAVLINEKIEVIYELIAQIENIAEESQLSFWSSFEYGVGRRVNNP